MSDGNKKRAKVTRCTDLKVWRRSHRLLLDVLTDLEKRLFLDVLSNLEHLPSKRQAAIRDQVIRSLGSVGANIAEGFQRSQAKYRSSLDIAQGEAREAEKWLREARDARCLDCHAAALRIRESMEIQKMLHGLLRSS